MTVRWKARPLKTPTTNTQGIVRKSTSVTVVPGVLVTSSLGNLCFGLRPSEYIRCVGYGDVKHEIYETLPL
jgi:hypothetical protein